MAHGSGRERSLSSAAGKIFTLALTDGGLDVFMEVRLPPFPPSNAGWVRFPGPPCRCSPFGGLRVGAFGEKEDKGRWRVQRASLEGLCVGIKWAAVPRRGGGRSHRGSSGSAERGSLPGEGVWGDQAGTSLGRRRSLPARVLPHAVFMEGNCRVTRLPGLPAFDALGAAAARGQSWAILCTRTLAEETAAGHAIGSRGRRRNSARVGYWHCPHSWIARGRHPGLTPSQTPTLF